MSKNGIISSTVGMLSSPVMIEQYLEIADVIILVLDKKGDVVLINRKGEEVLGWKKEELLGKNWFTACIPENDQKRAKKVFNEILEGKPVLHNRVENPIITRGGDERLISWHNSILIDISGAIIGTLSSGDDITESHRKEEILRNSEEKYRSFLENFKGIVFQLNMDLTPMFYHGLVEEITGYRGDEFVSGNPRWNQIVHPEDLKNIEESLKKVRKISNYSDTREYRIIRKDGEVRWVSEMTHTISDEKGKSVKVQGTIQDITEKKILSDELKKTQEEWETIFQAIGDPVLIMDPKHNILNVNRATLKSVGLSSDEILGKKCFDIFHKLNKPPEGCPLEKLLKSGHKEAVAMEIEALDGTYLVSCTPVFDDKGELKNIIHIATDITEQKKSQDRIMHLNRVLRSISEINQLIVREKNTKRLLEDACEIIVEVSGYLFSWIGLIEEGHKRVIPTAHWGFEDGYLDTIDITWDDTKTGRGPTGTAIKTKKTCVLRDVLKDPKYEPWRGAAEKRGYKSSVAIPLVYDDVVYGVLNVYAEIIDFFDDEEINLLQEVGNDLAYAISSIKVEQERNRLFNLSIDMLSISGFDGSFKQLNPAWENTLGWSNGELLSKPWIEFVHPDDRDKTNNAMQQLMRGDPVHLFENRYECKDGSYRWISWNSFPYKEEGLIFGVARDITYRKKAAMELEESRRKLTTLISNLPGAVYRCKNDRDWTMEFISDGVYELTGYKSIDLIDNKKISYNGLIHPDDRECVRNEVQKEIGGGNPFLLEYRIRTAAGTEKWVWERGVALKVDGEDEAMLEGYIIDISDRKNAQEAIVASEKEYRELVENIGDIIYIVDGNGTIKYFNEAFRRATNYNREELFGKKFSDFIVPDSYEEAEKVFKRQLGGEDVGAFELNFYDKDGQIRTIEIREKLIWDSDTVVEVQGIGRDISERKHAEEALRESERKYRNVIDNANEVIVVFQEGATKFVNPLIAKISGYSVDEFLSNPFMEFIHPDDREIVTENYLKRIKGKEIPDAYVVRAVSKKDNIIWVEVGGVKIEWEGKPASLLFLTDITDRKRAEDRLRESEEKFRNFFNDSRDIIYFSNVDGRILDINKAAEDLSGFTREEMLNFNLNDAMGDKNMRGEFIKIIDEQGYVKDFESYYKRKDGSKRYCVETATPRYDSEGNIVGYQGIIRDITENKLAVEALRESEERFRNMSEIIPIVFGMYSHNMEKVLFVNDAFEKIYGYSSEEFYKNPGLWYELIHEDDKKRVAEKIAENFSNEFDIEYRIIRHGNEVRWIYDRLFPIKDEDGNLSRVVWIGEDITEQKKMEEKLIQAEKLSSLGGILSGVAHELNNPLTAIIGNAQLLVRKDVSLDIKNKLEIIRKESVRSSKIVGGLLAFAREHKPEKMLINVNDVIMEAYGLREYELRVENVKINLDLLKDMTYTSADPFQLQQVFINLINNAHDALMEKSGGILSIRSFQRDGKIIVEFEDNGIGIPNEKKKIIFDPFFTTKEIGKGTGLGLSIVYGIVAEHDGTIDVESIEGKGTKFTIELPIVRENIVKEKESTEKPKGPVGKIKVLVVEDEESLRNFLVEELINEGYTVEMAEDGEKGIELLESRDYDIVITDMKMPGLSGQNLYNYIQKNLPELIDKIIFITGDVLGQETQNFLNITGAKFIEKPFVIEQLLAFLSELIIEDENLN